MSYSIGTLGVVHSGNINEQVATRVALRPAALAAGATNGLAINRKMAGAAGSEVGPLCKSALFTVFTGAFSGTPTTGALAAKLQHCATSGGTYVDATAGGAGSVVDLAIADSCENNQKTMFCDLTHLEEYVRLVVTPAFTGGSTPKVETAALMVSGEWHGEAPITQQAET